MKNFEFDVFDNCDVVNKGKVERLLCFFTTL